MKRAAVLLLVFNAAFATVSLVGIVGKPLWPLLDWDFAAIAMVLGVLNIATAFSAAVLDMASSQGWLRTGWLLGLCVILGGGMELLSTETGVPFGAYGYTDQLGPKFLGRVPYVIIVAWFMMFYPSLHMAHGLKIPRWLVGFVAGGILTLWDVALEAAMTTGFACWEWRQAGQFYGIPLQNWIGWFLTASLIGILYTVLVRDWDRDRSRFPVALYTVQSLFAAMLALLYGRGLASAVWGAGFLGLMAALHRRGDLFRTRADLKAG